MPINGMDAAVKLLTGIMDLGRETILNDITLEPLPAGEPPEEVWAIDGGSRVLFDLPGVVIGAYRASSVRWTPSDTREERGALVVDPIAKRDQKELLGQLGYGEDKESWEAASLAVGLHRKKLEWKTVRKAVERANKGAFVLVDGSLDPVMKPLREVSSRAIERAGEKGVFLVGISKKSDLSAGGLPYVPVLGWKAASEGVEGGWFTEVPRSGEGFDTFIVRFTGFSEHVFRVDAAAGGIDAVSRLARLCNDAGYPGYPFPLARAHNISVIDGDSCEDLRTDLEGRLGGDSSLFWRCISRDFHKVLDGGVP